MKDIMGHYKVLINQKQQKNMERKSSFMEKSYDIAPPLLLEDDKRHPKFNNKFKDIDCELPVGESLKNVIERLSPFLDELMDYIRNNSGDHIIVAH